MTAVKFSLTPALKYYDEINNAAKLAIREQFPDSVKAFFTF
jgi:hypothetical protein